MATPSLSLVNQLAALYPSTSANGGILQRVQANPGLLSDPGIQSALAGMQNSSPGTPGAPPPIPASTTGAMPAPGMGTPGFNTLPTATAPLSIPGSPRSIGDASSLDPATMSANPSASGLPINLGGLNLGNINTAAILPAILSSGLGLWSLLGAEGNFTQAGNLVNNAETAAGTQVNNAAQGAASGVTGAATNGNNLLGQLYNSAQSTLSPYGTAGSTAATTLNSDLAPGGALNSNLTADQVLQNDPGYQFRLGEGMRQIQAMDAAKGLTGSGVEDKALESYAQDYATNAYQQAFQNQQTQQQNLFGRLYGTSGLGETATGQGITSGEAFGAPQASNLINAAENAGGFDLAGSQYQGNANVTGAGAQAGALIDINQQKQGFIQQLLTSLLSLFQGGASNPANPFGLTGSDNSGLSQLAGILTGAPAPAQ